MSSIIAKPFNAAQRIVRAIFKGSPNLFTTSDLNRQLEAIKYQLDLLDDKTGVQSNIQILGFSQDSGDGVKVNINAASPILRAKGCDFSSLLVNGWNVIGSYMSGDSTRYWLLCGTQTEVSYYEDSSHAISGATFVNGTSKPAANHIVWSNVHFEVRTSLTPASGSLIAVLASLNVSGNNVTLDKSNIVPVDSSILFLSDEKLMMSKGTPTVQGGTISVGQKYDEAITRVNSILFGRKNGAGSRIYFQGTTIKWCISNGLFRILIPSITETLTVPSDTHYVKKYPIGLSSQNGDSLRTYLARTMEFMDTRFCLTSRAADGVTTTTGLYPVMKLSDGKFQTTTQFVGKVEAWLCVDGSNSSSQFVSEELITDIYVAVFIDSTVVFRSGIVEDDPTRLIPETTTGELDDVFYKPDHYGNSMTFHIKPAQISIPLFWPNMNPDL